MKTKQLICTLAILISVVISKAQEKYEFMVIEYVGPPIKVISISIDGVQFEALDVVYTRFEKSGYNANPLLAKVKEYQDQDWEVMNFATQIGGGGANTTEFFFAYLRKRKTEKKEN